MIDLNKRTKAKPKPKPTLIFKNCSCVWISLCKTVVHNTEQNSSDNFPLILQAITIAQTMSTGGEAILLVPCQPLPSLTHNTFLPNLPWFGTGSQRKRMTSLEPAAKHWKLTVLRPNSITLSSSRTSSRGGLRAGLRPASELNSVMAFVL